MNAADYTPARLFGTFGALRLLSAFQVVAGRRVPGLDIKRSGASEIIASMTLVKIESNAALPENANTLDLAGWLKWLACEACEQGNMDMYEPMAWAVPAAAELGYWI